jgi:hypothetical protein
VRTALVRRRSLHYANVAVTGGDASSADDWARCGYYYFMQFSTASHRNA